MLDRLEAGSARQQRRQRAGGRAARARLPSATCRRTTRRTCSRPSGSTRPSCATRDWDDLMDYCAYSAMPVGRFVLDVHGESRSHLAGVGRHLRGAADHQPPAGLRQRITAIWTASISRSMPSPPAALASRRSGEPRHRRNCAAASRVLARAHRASCCTRATRCRAWSKIRGSRSSSRSSRRWRRISPACSCGAIRLSERVHLGKLGVAGISLLAVLNGSRAPRRPFSRPTFTAAQP